MDVLNETSNCADERVICNKFLKKYNMFGEVKKDCIFGANDYIDANFRDKHGNTALILFSHFRREKIVKILLTPSKSLRMMGADINFQNDCGNTALIIACNTGYIKIIKMLLEANADVNLQNEDGDTALIIASGPFYDPFSLHFNSKDIVKMLLDAGADVDIENNDGETALTIALENKHFNIVKLLCG